MICMSIELSFKLFYWDRIFDLNGLGMLLSVTNPCYLKEFYSFYTKYDLIIMKSLFTNFRVTRKTYIVLNNTIQLTTDIKRLL